MDAALVEGAVAADCFGGDQADAVRELCAQGPALRSLIAPAGFGKTSTAHAAATTAAAAGRPVLGAATTNRAVAELRDVGIPAVTIARLALDMADRPLGLAPDTVIILDELPQTATTPATALSSRCRWFPDDPHRPAGASTGGRLVSVSSRAAGRQSPPHQQVAISSAETRSPDQRQPYALSILVLTV